MRILLGVSVVGVCLALAGCKSSSGSTGAGGTAAARSSNPNAPFLGAPSPASSSTTTPAGGGRAEPASSGPSPKAGVLAGRILDEYNRTKPEAVIQVIDLDARDGAKPMKVLADKDGNFYIAGLEGGHAYRLVARVKEGARILTGSQRVVAPSVRIAIFLNQALPLNDSSADAASPPPRTSDAVGSNAAVPAVPPAALGSPIKTPAEGVTTPLPGSEGRDASRPAAGTNTPGFPPPKTSDPSLIADQGKKTGVDGFPQSVPAEIGGPGREPQQSQPPMYTPPPPPPETGGSANGTTTPLPATTGPSAATPSAGTGSVPAIPSCNKNGDQVDNFAVYDAQGKPWELRDHKSKLTLIDFWFTGCAPCRMAIPHLSDLQKKYAPYGLQVVGIAYESGSLAEKQQAVRSIRTRYPLNYTVLFGGEKESCPVLKQFEVASFPTLFLLDESGKIIFHREGLNPQAAYDLEIEIRRQVGLRLK